ncbi:hypothetical protein GCM10027176_67060 [Actinoallomurus bryophytorum]|uniref:Uncharacterized protein n=1 Tax=Actinoallomurus bryophytorum TaxID=1490222 RepID=A0A543BZ26_9ACTN|nr:hypothetical protein [Actinoallomurus bryophytorum]TQL90071.1 hypothetical protein FB559_7363 [Actinoallomurus bryophytorum]
MTRRRLISLAGGLALVVVAVVVTVLTYGGHGSHGVAAPAPTISSLTLSPFVTPSPTPSGTPHHRHRTTVKKAAATARRGTPGSSGGHSGVLPADPCAHNHHCHVPPAPPLKPDPRPPVGPPVATVSGAPAGPPAGG